MPSRWQCSTPTSSSTTGPAGRTCRFVEDHLQDYQAPSLALYRLIDGLGKPVPAAWPASSPTCSGSASPAPSCGIVEKLDVNLVTWIHSIPMPVPHTRPVGVTVHGNRPELIEGISVWKPTVEVPAAVGHILELRLTEAGRNVAGYVIHVPHYLAEAEYPTAAVAGLEYLGAATSLMLPTDRLREAGREVGRQIAEQIEASEDVQQVVSRLEARYDEKAEGTVRRSLLADENDELPNGDELGAAVEAYLARENPGQVTVRRVLRGTCAHAGHNEEVTAPRAWLIWTIGIFAYLVAVSQRTSFGVVGLEATERFHASASAISFFTVLQLLVYAGLQIPVGLLVDRFGSRAMIAGGAVLMGLGQLQLAFADSIPGRRAGPRPGGRRRRHDLHLRDPADPAVVRSGPGAAASPS